MKRFFYGVQCKDEHIQSIFDLMIFLAAPHRDKHQQTHITLKGPYEEPKNFNSTLKSEEAILVGIETFDTPKGAALVLLAKIDGVKDVWDKPSYPDGEPHLTLCEGEKQYINDLFIAVKKYEIFPIKIGITQLMPINYKLLLAQEFPNYETIKLCFETIFRKNWHGPDSFRKLDAQARANHIVKAMRFLSRLPSNLNVPKKFSSPDRLIKERQHSLGTLI